MTSSEHPIQPYAEWPSNDKHRRWLRAGNAFGVHLIAGVRDAAIQRTPAEASPETKRLVKEGIDNCLAGVTALLDTYLPTEIDGEHRAIYVLLARICRKGSTDPIETFELAPDGDGLQMGYWGWIENDFGQKLWSVSPRHPT